MAGLPGASNGVGHNLVSVVVPAVAMIDGAPSGSTGPIASCRSYVSFVRRHDLYQHFARPGSFQVQLDDLERRLRREGYGGTGFHSLSKRAAACRTADGSQAGD